MPILVIFTNKPSPKVPAGFMKDITELTAKLLKKPAAYVCVRLHTDQCVTFGGTNAPAATVDLYSIGCVGPEQNKGHTEALGKFIQAKLGVPIDRLYTVFHDLEGPSVGFNGDIFPKGFKI